MDTGAEQSVSSPASPSSPREQHDGNAAPAKRPAGRTKFRETRHPVYRGVRRRGGAGRWVREVRVPGKRGERLWLGTHVTAESAARAHDAAMLALLGRSASAAACLNFADSAWLLAVPSALSSDDLEDVRRAALADFQRKQTRDAAVTVNEVTPSAAAPSSSLNNAGSLSATSCQPSADGMFELPVALGSDMFELDMSVEMDLGTYYADLAEGLLLEPPATGEFCDNGGADDVSLWRH